MKIYMVRHGKYEVSIPPTIPKDGVNLTPQAKVNISKIARSLTGKGIEAVYSSTLKRATQTAKIFSEKLSVDVIENDLFRERRQPREIVGRPVDDITVQEILNKIIENYFDLNFKYSDEENFVDLKSRGLEIINYLLNVPENKILLVIHAEIEAMILSLMIFGEELTPELFVKLRSFFFIGLGTPSTVEYKNEKWRLMQWNFMLDEFMHKL